MRTSTHIITGLFLATTALINIPFVAADVSINAAYENFSGTHAGKTQMTPEGMRGSEGVKGVAGAAGAKPALPFINQAYEDLSGTHPTSPSIKAGMKGSSGVKGETGAAGEVDNGWSPFNISGDVPNGCSKYLRCN